MPPRVNAPEGVRGSAGCTPQRRWECGDVDGDEHGPLFELGSFSARPSSVICRMQDRVAPPRCAKLSRRPQSSAMPACTTQKALRHRWPERHVDRQRVTSPGARRDVAVGFHAPVTMRRGTGRRPIAHARSWRTAWPNRACRRHPTCRGLRTPPDRTRPPRLESKRPAPAGWREATLT
jgi:hypothetical protein